MLRRYLQNNNDVCLILNFLCILPIFKIWSLQHIQTVKICKIQWNWWFLKVSIVLQISPQRKLISLWNLRLIFIRFEIDKELFTDFLYISVHTCAHTRQKYARTHFIASKRTRSHLRLLCARVCTDLYEKSFDNSLLSYEYKSKISLRSELVLRRYLQNNTDVWLILNFLCFFNICWIFASKFHSNLKLMQIFLDYLETQFQNVTILLEKIYLSQLTVVL